MHSVVAKIMTLGAVAGIAAVLALSTGRTALGAEGAELSPDNATIRATDFSARKKYRTYRTYPFAFAPPRYYRAGANPNYGPGTPQLLQARRQNRCVTDEGYGRWTTCSNE